MPDWFDERVGMVYHVSVGLLDDKFMLQHNEVAFTGLVSHNGREMSAKRVEEIASHDRRLLLGENAHPLHASDDAFSLFLTLKLRDFPDPSNKRAETNVSESTNMENNLPLIRSRCSESNQPSFPNAATKDGLLL
jgi:hypothetical protein